MHSSNTQNRFTRDEISKVIVNILQDMTRDWEIAFSNPINEETYLMRDLTVESIDVVMLIVAIEEQFDRKGLPFEELLMVDGRYVEDIRVGEIADFLEKHLNQPAAQGG